MASPERGVRLTEPVFLAHNPEWAWNPNSGEGARRYGGRFNRLGVAALYTSLDPVTAIREASPLGQPMQPLTLCKYAVDCDCILDTRDGDTLPAVSVTSDDLRCPRWAIEMLEGQLPASQRTADRLIALGYRGLIVWSFARGTTSENINVVFWDWSDEPPNQVKVVDPQGRLPRDRRSWRS